MKNLVDRFGTKFDIEEDTEDTFLAHVTVQISPTFYGWLTQYGDSIQIVAPENVIDGTCRDLEVGEEEWARMVEELKQRKG